MNVIAWVVALLASLWFTVYCFGTLDSMALGYAGLGLVFLCIPQIIAGAWEDIRMLKNKQEDEG